MSENKNITDIQEIEKYFKICNDLINQILKYNLYSSTNIYKNLSEFTTSIRELILSELGLFIFLILFPTIGLLASYIALIFGALNACVYLGQNNALLFFSIHLATQMTLISAKSILASLVNLPLITLNILTRGLVTIFDAFTNLFETKNCAIQNNGKISL